MQVGVKLVILSESNVFHSFRLIGGMDKIVVEHIHAEGGSTTIPSALRDCGEISAPNSQNELMLAEFYASS